MMKFAARLVGAGVIAGMLSACSSATESPAELPKALAKTVIGAVQSRQAPPPQPVVVTPQDFARITTPILQVNPANTGGSDFLQRAASRRDSRSGRVDVWQSSDQAQIFLRNGVVVGTRGIGRDIIAADAGYAVNALRAGVPASGVRSFIISDGDVTTSQVAFQCELRALGADRVVIANQSFVTSHFRETCISDSPEFADLRNDYWVEAGTGLVRRSNQWMGPVAGYFETILLRN